MQPLSLTPSLELSATSTDNGLNVSKPGMTEVPPGPNSTEIVLVEGTGGVAVVAQGGWPIAADTALSFWVYPLRGDKTPYASTYISVDLALSDGRKMSDFEVVDQYGFPVTAAGQGENKTLYADQWNYVRCNIGDSLEGLCARDVEIVIEPPSPVEPAKAWVGDIRIGALEELPSDPVDLVDTRRGSNSTFAFSRGNTYPAAAVPNGFSLISPMTDWSRDWFYSWSRHNTPEGRTPFVGLALTHAPSPWMGDREQLIISPSWGDQQGTFSHDLEHALPYRYNVTLDGGETVTATPSDHGAIFQFEPANNLEDLSLLVGSIEGDCFVKAEVGSNELTGWVEEGSGLSEGHSRMFFAALATRPWSKVEPGEVGGQKVLSVAGGSQTLRIATSFISLEQARHALTTELGDKEPKDLAQEARDRWAERLNVLELPEASDDQKLSAYSSLYRLNLFPTSHYENTGTAAYPEYAYASPVLEHTKPTTDTETGARVLPGKLYVNHGFWDTYRTAWPLYALVYPDLAAELADGFVEFARTAGWTPRWSSPGYADLMPGTSSDAAFADLLVKGVPLPDATATYLAGLRNATATPTEPGVGRKDLAYRFQVFPQSDLPEAVAWAADATMNDAALANMARILASQVSSADQKTRLETEATYLARRSLSYRNGFDIQEGFFRSYPRPANFNPLTWGGDYTETNAWDYAFPAPHDGDGLAELYGGKQGLEAKLDEYSATPENADQPGTYGGPIHEMFEARETRMGQFALSNQPAHHIPFNYHFAAAPDKASRAVREAVARLFRGSAIGQGFPGDEDNGEMSSWYLFALTGLYPLQVGFDTYTLTAPGTPHVIWHLPGGDLNIRTQAAENFQKADAVAALEVDGETHDQSWLSHSSIRDGADLDFTLTAGPTSWGRSEPTLPSIGDGLPGPWRDLARDAIVSAENLEEDSARLLVDDTVHEAADVPQGASLTFAFETPAHPEMLTLTAGSSPEAAPANFEWQESVDGKQWQTTASFTNEGFDWPGQTRPFALPKTEVPVSFFRLLFTSAAQVAQVEVLV